MPRLLRMLLLPGCFACCIALLLHGAVVRGGGVWPRDRASLRMTMVRADAVELRRPMQGVLHEQRGWGDSVVGHGHRGVTETVNGSPGEERGFWTHTNRARTRVGWVGCG
mmetsp:Transcript_15414/g.33496  ORF Transcript_15414/g.33496 Transcript_15414/m.33496 type:complete len:110 (+) Transcript_15414:600-929(+)